MAPFKKIFSGGACPRTPITKRMALPCAACRFATCKFPNLKKKILGPPPLPNPGDAPETQHKTTNRLNCTTILYEGILCDVKLNCTDQTTVNTGKTLRILFF